jgi:hypothetical protein
VRRADIEAFLLKRAGQRIQNHVNTATRGIDPRWFGRFDRLVEINDGRIVRNR